VIAAELREGLLIGPEPWFPDEIDVFLFSAALWTAHRIHYDLRFAQEHGHSGVVLLGPQQVARMVQLIRSRISDHVALKSLHVSHLRPLYAREPQSLTAEVTDLDRYARRFRCRSVIHNRHAELATRGDLVFEYRTGGDPATTP
jgi:hydroxyacyl-ACP dehydratase HTD2-like protein with hotdog domain